MPDKAPTIRVPLPPLIRAVVALAAPLALILIVLIGIGAIAPATAIVSFAVVVAAVAAIVYRHLSGLEALRSQVENLSRDRPADNASETQPVDIPATAAELARAVAELDRSWMRRDAEQRSLVAANEAILEAIPDPLVLLGHERTVTRANAAARQLFGENVAGSDLEIVVRHPEILEAVEEGLAGRREVKSVDFTWPGPPERYFSARIARLPMPSPRGGTVLLVLHDVTALKQAEKMRADFVANVSHELRTPLSALLGFTETLRGAARDDTAARERFLGIMHEQAQRMTRLVRDLLSLSRIEESEHTPPTDRVEIARVISSALDTVTLQAKAKGIAVEVEAGSDLPPIAGDADQLAQVLQNLIDNAIKYGKTKIRIVARPIEVPPPRVTAAAGRRVVEPVTTWLSVAIGDDGEGIPREHLPRLTERFYRVDPARSRQMGGTGLGLAIVKHILNRHRGALTVESEPGSGSVFTMWLPSLSTRSK